MVYFRLFGHIMTVWTPMTNMNDWTITDLGDERILAVDGVEYKTNYSQNIIERLINRKGAQRASLYLTFQDVRTHHLLTLFRKLNTSTEQLRVLEVGCSAGQITEYLNEQDCIGEIYAFDVDRAFVDITRLKVDELNLDKVKDVRHLSVKESQFLPYDNNYFDVIIVVAVVEHLPFENRHLYVDQYYKKVKTGGIVGFWETPNKYYPFESHSHKLPFVQLLPPQMAYSYVRIVQRRKNRELPFTEFARAGGGWRNSSYYELLPKELMLDVEDVSEEYGYSARGWKRAILSRVFKVPAAFFDPYLNVVFRKVLDYESVQEGKLSHDARSV